MNNTKIPLGKLESVSLRKAWPNEASNFTPWLAEEENLSFLGETIGLHLELEETEKVVGRFSADILAKEANSGRWVVIENQVEPTDHKHLGQILTYAAGLEAKILVWIAESFKDEHRAAIDFLNSSTDESFAFFGIEIELFRIGDSNFAPSFTVVAKPNNWSKSAQAAKRAAEGQLSPAQLVNKEYWQAVIDKSIPNYPSLSNRVPYKGNWQTSERLITKPSLYCESNATFTKDRLRIEAYIGGVSAKAAFNELLNDKAAIEKDFGFKLEWELLPKGQDSRISFYMDGIQKRDDKSQWELQHEWLLYNWPKLSDAVRPYLQKLDVLELQQEIRKEKAE